MRAISLLGALALSVSLASPAHATVAIYTSAGAFAAATTIQHSAGFEGLGFGRSYAPFTQDGIQFTALGIDFYVTSPGQALTQNPNSFPSSALSADGDENFRIALASGAAFGSIGLDYATNRFAPPIITLFTDLGATIGSFAVPIAPDHVGFVGFVSTIPIGYATTSVDRGYIEDTAIDNVRLGPVVSASAVPEAGTWQMLILGFGIAGCAIRRSRATATVGSGGQRSREGAADGQCPNLAH